MIFSFFLISETIKSRSGEKVLMFDIITIGSATLDVFANTGGGMFSPCKHCPDHVKVPFGSKVLVKELAFQTGGGGTNTAVGFSRLGFSTAWIGMVGDDAAGRTVMEELHREGVNTRLAAVQKGGQSGYSIILDAKGHDRTVLAFKGCNDNLSLDFAARVPLQSTWVYCSSQLGQSAKALCALISRSKKNGISIAFNPSSYMITTERNAVEKILKHTDVLVFNAEEARLLEGRHSLSTTLRRIHQYGPHTVVITDGKKGAHASSNGEVWHCSAPAVHVREATGAGDAFATGFVAGLIKKHGLPQSLQMGMAEAGSVIQHIGAKNILMTPAELQRAVRRIPNTAVSRVP